MCRGGGGMEGGGGVSSDGGLKAHPVKYAQLGYHFYTHPPDSAMMSII